MLPRISLDNRNADQSWCRSWFRLPETMDRSFADLESLFQQGISARKFKHTKVERRYHVSPFHRIVTAVFIDLASLPQNSTRWWMPPLWTRRSSSRITSNTLKRKGRFETHRHGSACYGDYLCWLSHVLPEMIQECLVSPTILMGL